MALGSSHRDRGYTARSHNHRVGVGSLPGRLGFTSHLLWLLLLMEHVLMVKAALSPQPRRETCRSLAFVKSRQKDSLSANARGILMVKHRKGHPRAPCPSVTSQAPQTAFSKPARRESRMDRSLITVTAVGTYVRNSVPAIAKGLPAVLPGKHRVFHW